VIFFIASIVGARSAYTNKKQNPGAIPFPGWPNEYQASEGKELSFSNGIKA